MDNAFSRLEAREILRNLDTGSCDDEVVQKLVSIAESKTKAYVKEVAFVAAVFASGGVDLSMPRGAYGHLNDEEFEALRQLRGSETKRAAEQLKGISFEAMAPLQLPSEYAIERVAKGARNSVNDLCVEINADGLSIFVCPQGHGYIANNPSVHGCTTCAVSGNGAINREEVQETNRTNRVDTGAIPGEDSRW